MLLRKFIKKGDKYSILIIPKDIESIIRDKINNKMSFDFTFRVE